MKAASSPFTEVGLTGHTGSEPSSDVMHVTGLTNALGAHIASTPDTVRSGISFVGLTAIGLAVVTLPLAWIIGLATAVALAWTFGVILAYVDRPGPHEVWPESIHSPEIRGAYRALLSAFAELDRTVAGAPRLRASVASSLERCRAVVEICGQMAQHTNLLQQHPHIHEIAEQQATIRARLDLARAAIESFTAAVVKLRSIDRNRAPNGGPPAVTQLDKVYR